MKRWHEDFSKTHRQWKKHHDEHVKMNLAENRTIGRDPYQVDCICDEQKGRFRKRDARDCGKPRCQLCHGDKFPERRKTFQELLAQRRLKEGIDELNQFR